MGILAIGIGIGGLATYGALLHLINNSMTKGCLFLSAGNIQRTFGSKNLSQVRGAIAAVPVSGTLFLIGFLAVTGSPPFGLFMSEFTILRGIFGGGHTVVGVAFLTLLAMIFIGMGTTVLAATQGESKDTQPLYKDRFLLVAPPLIMILIVLLLGLYIPDSLSRLLQSAANLLEGKS
jgi:hydrogenase-4 component F